MSCGRRAEIPTELLDALTDDAGRLELPLRISGTAEDTAVRLDRDVLET